MAFEELQLGRILSGFQNLLNSEKGRFWSLRQPETKRILSSAKDRVMNSNNYHFEALIRDSGTQGNKWTKEGLCGGEYQKNENSENSRARNEGYFHLLKTGDNDIFVVRYSNYSRPTGNLYTKFEIFAKSAKPSSLILRF